MEMMAILAGLVLGFVLGTGLLYLSLRLISKAQGHLARSAVAYLAMLLGGGVVGSLFFVSVSIHVLRPVMAFIIFFGCAAICQWVIGCAMFRRIVLRRRLAVAIPVVVLYFLACIGGIPFVMSVERRAFQISQLSDLHNTGMDVKRHLYENETTNEPVPESLAKFPANAIYFGRISVSDLGYLPEYLAQHGIHRVSLSNDFKNGYPLLWLNTKQDGNVLVVFFDGHGDLLARAKLETLLNAAVAELSAKRASYKNVAKQPVEGAS